MRRYVIPDGTFLQRWLSTCSALESPTAFDLATGLYLISAVLGREVYINRPVAYLRTNCFIGLIGDAGKVRKSTIIRLAKETLGNALLQRELHPITISGRTSSGGVTRLLSEVGNVPNNAINFITEELVSLLGKQGHLSDMPALLTELYDCPSIATGRASNADGLQTMHNVYATLLFGSAPSWLFKSINPDALEGGFLSRVILVVGNAPKKLIPWGDFSKDKEGKEMSQHLSKLHQSVTALGGVINVSQGAVNAYTKWYKTRQAPIGKYAEAIFSREQDHILRIAGLLAVNEGTLLILPSHFYFARKFVMESIKSGEALFATRQNKQATNDKLFHLVSDICAFLIGQGGEWTTQTSLTKRYQERVNSRGLLAILDVMLEFNAAQHVIEKPPLGRPRRLWRGTTALLKVNVHEVCQRIDKSR